MRQSTATQPRYLAIPHGPQQRQYIQTQQHQSPICIRPTAAVVRMHRASLPAAPHHIAAARKTILYRQPPQQDSQDLILQLQRTMQQLQLKQQQLQKEEVCGLSSRTPAPLPSAWRAQLELCPDEPALGGGAFAEVFKVQNRQTKKGFAMKVMHRPNFTLRGIEKQIGAEIDIMRLATELSQKTEEDVFVVSLLDVIEEGEYVFLLLELCEQGDLLQKMQNEPTQKIRETEAVNWARQLLQGLKVVHSLGYIHRDIKPDNLLCTASGTLKIADFGWCCTVQEAPTSLAGTFTYMAPEVLGHVPQTVQADVWSTGVTLYQMLTGRALLQTYLGPGATNLTECDPHGATALKQKWLIQEINSSCPPSFDFRPYDISETCWDFLRQLLVPDPTKRITVEDALKHPWLKPRIVPKAVEAGLQVERLQSDKNLQSPKTSVRKDLASSPDRATPCQETIALVPTPLKPRVWDPSRNMAYTPPVTPEMTPDRSLLDSEASELQDVKDNTASEVLNLKNGYDQISCKWGSPKDTLLEKEVSVRAALRNSPSPQKGNSLQAKQISTRRMTIASQQPATGIQEIGIRGSLAAEQLRFDRSETAVAQKLLTKLHSCDDEPKLEDSTAVAEAPSVALPNAPTLQNVKAPHTVTCPVTPPRTSVKIVPGGLLSTATPTQSSVVVPSVALPTAPTPPNISVFVPPFPTTSIKVPVFKGPPSARSTLTPGVTPPAEYQVTEQVHDGPSSARSCPTLGLTPPAGSPQPGPTDQAFRFASSIRLSGVPSPGPPAWKVTSSPKVCFSPLAPYSRVEQSPVRPTFVSSATRTSVISQPMQSPVPVLRTVVHIPQQPGGFVSTTQAVLGGSPPPSKLWMPLAANIKAQTPPQLMSVAEPSRRRASL